MKLASWLGERRFWNFLNLNVASVSEKELKDSVKLCYQDDEYLQLMPGAKDYVSVERNVHQQKHLLLCNLKELYQSCKKKVSQHKIALSKFCKLRPKWYITIFSSSTHSVCVCTVHQNTNLIFDAFSVPSTRVSRNVKGRYFYKNKKQANGSRQRTRI